MGGMAAFIPSRRDAAVNESALIKVNEDKQREARLGFDGTWVAHPDLVPVAMKVFDQYLGAQPHQKEKGIRTEVFDGQRLLPTNLPDGKITEAGFRNNVSVALQYIEAWLRGQGAVAIFNLMEDAATAEISRAELWQWVQRTAVLDNGTVITKEYFQTILNEELAKLGSLSQGRYASAVKLLQELVLATQFTEFLTTPAYQLLETP
jgi:malate synthase